VSPSELTTDVATSLTDVERDALFSRHA